MQYDGLKREDRSVLPIGVFWDIENCQVPRGKSATALANRIRELFFVGHREAEFLCVCDIRKERPEVVQELNLAQVTVVHINAISKNAADDKLKQCMRRYVDIHGSPATLLLISGDVNFSTELSDFRHRQKIRVLLLHSPSAPEALMVCAHECYSFAQLASALPFRTPTTKGQHRTCELVVQDLPTDKEYNLVQNRLRQLSNNCGGRVLSIVGATAYLRFPNPEAALRASKRMDGEDVFGSLIAVSLHTTRRRRSRGLREDLLRDRSSSSSRSPESSSVEADSFRAFPPPDLNASLSNDYGWCEENLRNLASFAAEVEANCAQMGQESQSIGHIPPFLRCNSQPEVQTGHDDDDEVSAASHPSWRTLSPSPDSSPTSSTSSRQTMATAPTARASSFEGPRSRQHKGATAGGRLAGSPRSRPTSMARAARRPSGSSAATAVDVCVTNLDPGIEANDLKKMLLALFQEHVMVLHISLALTPNGCFMANVRVPSAHDAQLAVDRLQQCRLGERCLKLSFNDPPPPPPTKAAAEPLHCALHHPPPSSSSSSSSTSSTFSSTASSTPSSSSLPTAGSSTECSRGWALWVDVPAPLPSVCLPRARFGAHLECLLDTHTGSLPLDSFQSCYEAEFGPLPLAPTRLEPWKEGCVPLEHLVASLPGITVVTSAQGFKRAMREPPEDPLPNGAAARLLTPELKELSREVVELLCKQEQCALPMHQFIPAFHRHFGRQCRLADYGCTRLLDLLAAIGHVVEILGHGHTRLVTLTHEAQLGRFAADVKVVLEDPGSPQTLLLSSLPQRFQDVHRRALRVADYGSCTLDDLLRALPKSVVLVEQRAGNTLLMLPERGPTEEEAGRLRELASELVKLLGDKGDVLLSQLSPAYQQMYGRKLRTSRYGPFRKLLALLEAIPDVVEVHGVGNRRMVQLTSAYQSPKPAGHPKTPTVPSAGHQEEPPQVSVVQPPSSPPPPVVLDVREEALLDVLSENPGGSLDLGKLWDAVHARSGSYPDLLVLRKLEASGHVTIDRQAGSVRLSPLVLLARQLRQLLRCDAATTGGGLSLTQLEEAYRQKHSAPPALCQLGFSCLEELLSSQPEYFDLSGTQEARSVSLASASKGSSPKPDGQEQMSGQQPVSVASSAAALPVSSKPKAESAAAQQVNPEPVTGRVAAQPVSSKPVAGSVAAQTLNHEPVSRSAATQLVSSEPVARSAAAQLVSPKPVGAATQTVSFELLAGSEATQPLFPEPGAKSAAAQLVSPKPVGAATQTVSSELLAGSEATQPLCPEPGAKSAAAQLVSPKLAAGSAETQTISSELLAGSEATQPVSSEPVAKSAAAQPVSPEAVAGSAAADCLEAAEEAELLELLPEGLLDEPIPSGVPSPEIRPELSPASASIVAAPDLMQFEAADQGAAPSLKAESSKIFKPVTSPSPAAPPVRRRLAAFFPV